MRDPKFFNFEPANQSHTRWPNVFFEPDSAQPNQRICGPYRNKKKFSSDCEVYEGVKKGGGKGGGNLSIGLWSSKGCLQNRKNSIKSKVEVFQWHSTSSRVFKKGGGKGCAVLEHYMYLQYASGVSTTLFIPIFWVNFTFRCQSCSHSGRTPFRPPFLKVQFFKNMNAYASVPKNGLFIHTFFFFVRSNELKHQKKWDFMAWFESFVHLKSCSGCKKSRFLATSSNTL